MIQVVDGREVQQREREGVTGQNRQGRLKVQRKKDLARGGGRNGVSGSEKGNGEERKGMGVK